MAVSKKILWILIGVSLKFTLLLGAIIDTESTDSSEISIESEDIADKNQLIFVHVVSQQFFLSLKIYHTN